MNYSKLSLNKTSLTETWLLLTSMNMKINFILICLNYEMIEAESCLWKQARENRSC